MQTCQPLLAKIRSLIVSQTIGQSKPGQFDPLLAIAIREGPSIYGYSFANVSMHRVGMHRSCEKCVTVRDISFQSMRAHRALLCTRSQLRALQ